MKKEHSVTVLFDAGWTALPWYLARHIFLAVERGESVPPEEVAPGSMQPLFEPLNCSLKMLSYKYLQEAQVSHVDLTKNWY